MIDHTRVVDAWLERHRPETSAELFRLFERAMRALWGRAGVTIGEVPLTSVVSSVLLKAQRRYASLRCVTVEPSGVRCDHTLAAKAELQGARAAIRFMLVEFLTLMGNLNANILTSPLHEEIDRMTPNRSRAVTRRVRRREQETKA